MKARVVSLLLVVMLPALLASQTTGQMAPEFTGSLANRNFLSLSSLRGQVVVVAFWAAWCAPCKRNMPDLRTLNQKYSSKGLITVPIGMSPSRETDIMWLRNNGYNFPFALFTDGWKTAPWYTVNAIPWMAVIDRSGIIRWIGHANIPEGVLLDALNSTTQ